MLDKSFTSFALDNAIEIILYLRLLVYLYTF
jgi:hypothetical protein